jgi:hypothetical protein
LPRLAYWQLQLRAWPQRVRHLVAPRQAQAELPQQQDALTLV